MVNKLLTWLLGIKDPPMPKLDKDEQIKLLSGIYQNPAYRRYSTAREQYLIERCAQTLTSGQVPDAKFVAGQLLEVREFRNRTRTAWTVIERSKKKDRLHKEKK